MRYHISAISTKGIRHQKALLSACKGHFKICSKRSNCKFLNMFVEPGHSKCHQRAGQHQLICTGHSLGKTGQYLGKKTGVGEAAEPSTWQSTESSVACPLGSPCPVEKSSLKWASLKTSEEVQRKITLITPCKSMQKKTRLQGALNMATDERCSQPAGTETKLQCSIATHGTTLRSVALCLVHKDWIQQAICFIQHKRLD